MGFDPKTVADGVWVGLSILSLTIAFQHILLSTLVDGFRDRLFALRRELFLLVADSKIAPTDLAYVSFRRHLNGMIRFAERITFMRLAFTGIFVWWRFGAEGMRSMHDSELRAFDSIPDVEVRDALKRIHRKMSVAGALHIFASSPIAWLLTLLAAPVLVLVGLVTGTIDTIKKHILSEVSDRIECDVETLIGAA